VISIDFEFNHVNEHPLNLVCCSVFDTEENQTYSFWLHKDKEAWEALADFLTSLKDKIFLAYAASSEARCLYSLGLDPYQFKFIDDFLEYRCLSNHNDELNWGNQLVDGKVKFTRKPPPKWERTEEDSLTGFKPTHSLAEATYKLLGVIRDTEHKTKMRDLIISAPAEFTEEEKRDIMAYCDEDTQYLPAIHEAMVALYKKYLGVDFNEKQLEEDMLLRGKYAALTGVREARGYPINVQHTKNFSRQVLSILDDCQREINDLFPDIKPFNFNKKTQRFSWSEKKTRDWIRDNVPDAARKWKKTDGGKKKIKELSLSLEAFTQFFDYTHHYPKDNFGAQMVRFLKLKQNVYGFVPSEKKRTFWDSVGSDGMVRPYMNIYGAQSARSQPPSTSYLLLKPAWMRALMQPPTGKCIASIDYGSEEYFIAALFYNDKVMIDSYLSGDVYLAFAIFSGMAPEGATKSTHKKERDLAKSTTLGISYLMTKYGLARKLTADTGIEHDEDEAQDLIEAFYETYADFAEGQQRFIEDYQEYGKYCSPTGWFMWGDNDNHRSVGNVPIQCLGSEIMRRADMRCYEEGVHVPCTLHDALYIMHDIGDYTAIDIAMREMKEAFAHFFPEQREIALQIRLDPFTWGPDLPAPTIDKDGTKIYSTITTPEGNVVECSDIYIDERAEDEYKAFSKYFLDREEDLL
jgi:hypothetical protein